jgi:capsule biosynthesis phosphatase
VIPRGVRIVIDLDGTLCPIKSEHQTYEELTPHAEVVAKLREYKDNGAYIIVHTSRNMRTYSGNLGLINANTAKTVITWLDRHSIPYDELHFGKPWPGTDGFYVDDRAIRPEEFVELDYENIQRIIG